jgi:hypothetical protein
MSINTVSQTDGSNGMQKTAEIIDIRHLSAEQLGQLGVSQIAYVKTVMLNGEVAFAIHAADGTPMAVADDRDLAIAAVRQHEMVPTLVH